MTARADLVMCRIEVPLAAFVDGLRSLKVALRRRDPGDAIVFLDDLGVHMQVGGADVAMPATGRWPGEARFVAHPFKMLARVPPRADPVVLRVEGGRFFADSVSVPCHWQAAGAAGLELPLGSTWLDVLKLSYAHAPEVLERSGFAARARQAKHREAQLVAKAAEVLAPLGVPAAAVQALVESLLSPASMPICQQTDS